MSSLPTWDGQRWVPAMTATEVERLRAEWGDYPAPAPRRTITGRVVRWAQSLGSHRGRHFVALGDTTDDPGRFALDVYGPASRAAERRALALSPES